MHSASSHSSTDPRDPQSDRPRPSPAPEKRRAASDQKRRRILDAARAVCARRGLDGTRMDEIAAEARVSKGTLYNYFDSKESLIVAGIVAHYEATADRVMAALPETLGPVEALERLNGILVDLFPEILSEMLVNFQSWGVAVQHAGARNELFTALAAHYAHRSGQIEALVAEGQRSGAFDPAVDPALFTRSWLAIYDGFVYRAAFDPEGARPEHLRASLREFVTRSLAGRCRVGAPESRP